MPTKKWFAKILQKFRGLPSTKGLTRDLFCEFAPEEGIAPFLIVSIYSQRGSKPPEKLAL